MSAAALVPPAVASLGLAPAASNGNGNSGNSAAGLDPLAALRAELRPARVVHQAAAELVRVLDAACSPSRFPNDARAALARLRRVLADADRLRAALGPVALYPHPHPGPDGALGQGQRPDGQDQQDREAAARVAAWLATRALAELDPDPGPRGWCYLLCFRDPQTGEHRPYVGKGAGGQFAGHYWGWTRELVRRIEVEHRDPLWKGPGRLVRVALAEGLTFALAYVEADATQGRERRLKRQGSAYRRCPLCRGTGTPLDAAEVARLWTPPRHARSSRAATARAGCLGVGVGGGAR